MPLTPTKNGGRNIYECMVNVSKLKPTQRQQHSIMLLQHYHKLCNMNDPSSIFVSTSPIPNIESLSQSTTSSLDSGLLGRNQADMNIQQQTTSEVADIETVMAYNEYLDLPPPQDPSNLFEAAELSYHSSSDSAKYKRAWVREKVIR